MSNGLGSIYRGSYFSGISGDPLDEIQNIEGIWDDEEITEVIRDINKVKDRYDPFSWLNPSCDCGGKKAKSTCALWCSTMEGNTK